LKTNVIKQKTEEGRKPRFSEILNFKKSYNFSKKFAKFGRSSKNTISDKLETRKQIKISSRDLRVTLRYNQCSLILKNNTIFVF